jgi:two-component system, OmpR family, sensor histidine kinase MtrB
MSRLSRLTRSWRSRLGLRARATLAFALGALLVSTLISLITYQLVRSSFIEQRIQQVAAGAQDNAQQVEQRIATPSGTASGAIAELDLEEGHSAYTIALKDIDKICAGDALSACSVQTTITEPVGNAEFLLRRAVVGNGLSYIVDRIPEGPRVVIGVPMRGSDERLFGAYFERVVLDSEGAYLRRLARSLTTAALIATLLGAGFGRLVSVRIMRPLKKVAAAATEIASGRLDTRIEVRPDTDLDPLVGSFNGMAESMQARIEREARFASDVSHELRTPLTSLSAAVQLLSVRRDEMSERSQTALDVLSSQTEHFRQLVLDLLEISRFDAGAAELNITDVDLAELVRQVAAGYALPIDSTQLRDPLARLDKRRVERILTNLFQNAQNYAGGAVGVRLAEVPGPEGGDGRSVIRIEVDDAGPGIPEAERSAIFDRFRRGSAQRSGSTKGTGLGLALVSEHARLHGGSVSVEPSPHGGSRFIVLLREGAPAGQEAAIGLDEVGSDA